MANPLKPLTLCRSGCYEAILIENESVGDMESAIAQSLHLTPAELRRHLASCEEIGDGSIAERLTLSFKVGLVVVTRFPDRLECRIQRSSPDDVLAIRSISFLLHDAGSQRYDLVGIRRRGSRAPPATHLSLDDPAHRDAANAFLHERAQIRGPEEREPVSI
jgi:hypothetical protein